MAWKINTTIFLGYFFSFVNYQYDKNKTMDIIVFFIVNLIPTLFSFN